MWEKLLFTILIACSAFKSIAQTASLRVSEMIKAGEHFLATHEYDSAKAYFTASLSVARQFENVMGIAKSYDRLAELMRESGQTALAAKYDSLNLKMAAGIKDTSLLTNAYNRLGIYFMEVGNPAESERHFKKSLQLKLEKLQNNKTAEVYSNLGATHLTKGEKDKAVEWFFKSLRLFEKNNYEKGKGETLSNISSVYYLMGRVDDAITYQSQSILIREKINDIPGLTLTHSNIGQLYILKEDYPKAFEHLQKAVRYAETTRQPIRMGAAYSAMSAYYSRTKKFTEARMWQNKAIKIFEDTNNQQLLSRLYVAAGLLAMQTGDSSAAAGNLDKGLELSLRLANKDNIANAYEKMSKFYQTKGANDRALTYYKNYVLYKDSIATSSALNKIEEIRTIYETEKKDNEIQRLNTAEKIHQLEIEKQKALIAGNNAEVAARQRQIELLAQAQTLRDLQLKQQGEALERQTLAAENKAQQLLLVQQKQLQSSKELAAQKELIRSQKHLRNILMLSGGMLVFLSLVLFNRYQLKRKIEEQAALLNVRQNIAKDLHDEVGSALTSIKILSEVSEKNLASDKKEQTISFLKRISQQSAEAQQGISDIVWSVMPENDKLENITTRMRAYAAETLEVKGIDTQIRLNHSAFNSTLSMMQRRDLLLIFKEAINNIAKYSKAKKVNISFDKWDAFIQMKIADDGVGFSDDKTRSGNGLKNMQQRAANINGTLHVNAVQGSGVTIVVNMPIVT